MTAILAISRSCSSERLQSSLTIFKRFVKKFEPGGHNFLQAGVVLSTDKLRERKDLIKKRFNIEITLPARLNNTCRPEEALSDVIFVVTMSLK
jgi:hypothetical protein